MNRLDSETYLAIARDLTDRSQAETSLRTSEAHLKEAQRIAQLGSWDWVAATDTPTWSRELCIMLEVDPDKPAPSVAEQDKLYTPASMRRMHAAIDSAMQTGEPYEIELERVRSDGSRRWLLARGERWDDDEGNVIGLRGTAFDITERKRVEAALSESEQRLRRTTSAANLGLWDWDLQTNAVWFSSEWKRQIGYEDNELSNNFAEWESRLHPDDSARAMGTVEEYLEKPWANYENEFRLRHKDGSYRWILARAAVVTDDSGKPLRMLGSHLDITERKQTEERIRKLNRIYAVLSDINQTIVREKNQKAMLEAACQIAVEKGGFRMAWVGLLDAAGQKLEPVASAGVVDGYLKTVNIDLEDRSRTAGPAARALHSDSHVVFQDLGDNPSFAPWREAALERGFLSTAAFPLKVDGENVGTFNLYWHERGFFDEAELRLLDELAMDISFALEVERHERERLSADDRLSRQRNELVALTGKIYGDGGKVQDSLNQITESAARTLNVERASIWRYNHDRTAIECVNLFQQKTGKHSAGDAFFESAHPSYFQALDEVEMIVADDAVSHPLTREFAEDYLGPLGISSMLDVPISIGGIRNGVLCHEHVGPQRQWTQDERNFAVAMANLVSLKLEEEERRQTEIELRWRTAFFEAQAESALDGILVVDEHGKKILQNQRLNDMFKFPKEIIENEDDAEQFEYFNRMTKNPKEVAAKVEYLYSHPDEISHDLVELVDGTVLDRVSSPVRDKAGKYYGRIWQFRDVTHQRQLEEQLRQSQKMEAIGQLAGGVAHDFNNILAAMLMRAELTQMRSDLPKEARDGLHEIRAAAERAANLTRQLLLFSRRQVMQSKVLDLNETVTGLAKMLQRIIGEDVRMQLNLHSRPLLTNADPGMLDQLLMNLVVNARDAMPNGGRLYLETSERSLTEREADDIPGLSEGRHVSLRVEDTGSGIAPETLTHIFEPFFTTKEPGKGTGLGLATVFGIVKQHGGAVTVESEVGKGTTFQIFLPAVDTAPAAEVESAQAAPLGGSETILLVEDDPAVRALTRSVLERHGYTVFVAAQGREALEIWQQHKSAIRLLYTDIVMPEGISGSDLAAQIRETVPDLPVVFTSGYSADIAGRGISLTKRQRFVQKPAQPSELLEAVRESLDEH